MGSAFWLLVAGLKMGGGVGVTSSGGSGGWHPPVHARPVRPPIKRVEPSKPTPRESRWLAELRIPSIRISARVAIVRAAPRIADLRPTIRLACPALRSSVTTARHLTITADVPNVRLMGKVAVRDNARVRRQEDALLAALMVNEG